MSFSEAYTRALLARQTDEAVIALVTASNVNWSYSPRYCQSDRDLVSNGDTYAARPFNISRPDIKEAEDAKLIWQVPAVDRELVVLLNSKGLEPVYVDIQYVSSKRPDIVEERYHLRLLDWRITDSDITGTLALENLMSEDGSQIKMDSVRYPGLH